MISDVWNWFAGGTDAAGHWRYMDLSRCMGGDAFWIALTIALDAAVAAGYVLIALHWSRNERMLPASPAKAALSTMRNIFIFCGICGYLFIPIKMFYPAWRLYDFFMMGLVYYTWKYAWNARDLKVIYTELGRTRQLAVDLEKTREESRQKSVFLNSLSHDLRTPLNGIALQTSLARVGVETNDPATTASAIAEIEASARAAADMLDRLLDYARLSVAEERNSLTTADLAAVLGKVVQHGRAAARQKGLDLQLICPAGLYVSTDVVKLERIVMNLINNAVKFTHTGGVKVTAEQDGSAVEIHVIDTGIGIPPQKCDELFQEFFQVDNHERDRTKGFGLGLATARRLARQLGGDVAVESSFGNGSCFSVLLPGCLARRGGHGSAETPALTHGHAGDGRDIAVAR